MTLNSTKSRRADTVTHCQVTPVIGKSSSSCAILRTNLAIGARAQRCISVSSAGRNGPSRCTLPQHRHGSLRHSDHRHHGQRLALDPLSALARQRVIRRACRMPEIRDVSQPSRINSGWPPHVECGRLAAAMRGSDFMTMLKNEYLRWFAIQSVNLVTWFAEGSERHGPREARPLRASHAPDTARPPQRGETRIDLIVPHPSPCEQMAHQESRPSCS